MATTSSVDFERARSGRYEPVTGRRKFLDRVIATDEKLSPAVARLMLGVVMFPHGAQKMFGWFGGHGFGGTVGFFSTLGIPSVIGALLILVEFLGAVALIVGAMSRIAAAGIAAMMVGAILTVHTKVGFFMNWSGQQAGEGYEYHLLAIGLAAVVFFAGGGVASVDRALTRKRGAVVRTP